MSLAVTAEELQAFSPRERVHAPLRLPRRVRRGRRLHAGVPFRREWERPGGIVSGIVFMTAADVAMWLAIKTQSGSRSFRHEPHADVLSPEREEQASSAGRRS